MNTSKHTCFASILSLTCYGTLDKPAFPEKIDIQYAVIKYLLSIKRMREALNNAVHPHKINICGGWREAPTTTYRLLSHTSEVTFLHLVRLQKCIRLCTIPPAPFGQLGQLHLVSCRPPRYPECSPGKPASPPVASTNLAK